MSYMMDLDDLRSWHSTLEGYLQSPEKGLAAVTSPSRFAARASYAR